MSMNSLTAAAFAAMVGATFILSGIGAQAMNPERDLRFTTVGLPARQISNVEWRNWEKGDDFYLGRFGKAYSVGAINLSRSGSSFFMIFQVKNVSPLVINAKCEVRASSSGRVVYTLDQRLRPGEISDPDGAGDMIMSHDGEHFTVSCRMGIPIL